jgi:glycosyltransferase involved in cell wall biosynthesis
LISVLFVHFGDEWIRGSEQVLLDLLSKLHNQVRPIVWCNSQAMAAACRSAGITTYRTDFQFYFDYPGPSQPNFQPRRFISQVRQGIELVRGHQIRAIHANSAAPCQWMVPVARLLKIPILAHLHAVYLRRTRFVSLAHQASMIAGCSQAVTNDFLTDGLNSELIKVIYNGINFDRLKTTVRGNLRQQLGIPDKAVVISSVGSLVAHKGHDDLICALKFIDPCVPVHVILAGDGPMLADLEQLARDLNFASQVHFVGYRSDVGTIYKSTDILAVPSRFEAFGLVLAEGGYFEIPVVATSVGGIPEIVENGLTGLIVPPNDPVAFGAALTRLAIDKNLRKRLGITAKNRIKSRFSLDKMADIVSSVYQSLIELPKDELGLYAGRRRLVAYARLIGGAKIH